MAVPRLAAGTRLCNKLLPLWNAILDDTLSPTVKFAQEIQGRRGC
jgi:hypothetical protein